METRLSKKLADKIASLDISHPYVWKLRLSEADFNELEVYLSAIVSDCGVAALAKPENAMTTIVYIAEWYKRKYQSGNRNQLIENLDLETLWTQASARNAICIRMIADRSVGSTPSMCLVVLPYSMS